MTELFLSAFVTLFVVLDPPGMAPIYAALTAKETDAARRVIALRGTLIAGIILIPFAFVGEWVLRMLGVTIDSFRIAGGLLLFMVAVDMIFAHETPLRRTTPGETEEASQRGDISVFPLAIPLIAGPGAMTTVVLLMQQADGEIMSQGVVIAVLVLVLALVLLGLLLATRMMRLIGVTGANVITRVLGVILGALAVQYVVDGMAGSFGAL